MVLYHLIIRLFFISGYIISLYFMLYNIKPCPHHLISSISAMINDKMCPKVILNISYMR